MLHNDLKDLSKKPIVRKKTESNSLADNFIIVLCVVLRFVSFVIVCLIDLGLVLLKIMFLYMENQSG